MFGGCIRSLMRCVVARCYVLFRRDVCCYDIDVVLMCLRLYVLCGAVTCAPFIVRRFDVLCRVCFDALLLCAYIDVVRRCLCMSVGSVRWLRCAVFRLCVLYCAC